MNTEGILNKFRKHPVNPPIEHHEFESLNRDGVRIRVRVVQYHHPKIGTSVPMLDIREYLENKRNQDGSVYTGWSKSGISLKKNDILELLGILPEAVKIIDSIKEK